jgi:hypothetical protein
MAISAFVEILRVRNEQAQGAIDDVTKVLTYCGGRARLLFTSGTSDPDPTASLDSVHIEMVGRFLKFSSRLEGNLKATEVELHREAGGQSGNEKHSLKVVKSTLRLREPRYDVRNSRVRTGKMTGWSRRSSVSQQ